MPNEKNLNEVLPNGEAMLSVVEEVTREEVGKILGEGKVNFIFRDLSKKSGYRVEFDEEPVGKVLAKGESGEGRGSTMSYVEKWDTGGREIRVHSDGQIEVSYWVSADGSSFGPMEQEIKMSLRPGESVILNTRGGLGNLEKMSPDSVESKFFAFAKKYRLGGANNFYERVEARLSDPKRLLERTIDVISDVRLSGRRDIYELRQLSYQNGSFRYGTKEHGPSLGNYVPYSKMQVLE